MAAQLPLPSHTWPLTDEDPTQIVDPHVLPAGDAVLHCPVDPQSPSDPHTFIPSGAHAFLGSVPSFTLSQ
jgi:hypothetical protein